MNKSKTRFGRRAVPRRCRWRTAPAAAKPVAIVALGDSLTAGYGLLPGESFPEQLEAALKARGHDVTVANAGVSGDTRADGLARLEWSVPADADIVIVELGANDALRGIDPAVTEKTLSEILAKLKARGQTVLLAGMLAPRNLGDAYAARIRRDLSGARRANTACALSVLPGRRGDRPVAQPGRRHASERGGRRRDRRARCCRRWRSSWRPRGRLTLTNRRARRRR